MVRRRQQQNRQTQAFTLIEMLTVLVIIGILLAVALPVVTHLTRAGALQSATRQIVNTASLARQFAITHRVNTELRITNTWDGVNVFTNNWPLDKWNYFPVGVIIQSNLSVKNIVFKPTGAITNSNDIQILIREGNYNTNTIPWKLFGTNSNCSTVTVNYILGRITVNRP